MNFVLHLNHLLKPYRYDRVMLRIIVTAGYLGWSAFSATALFFKASSASPHLASGASSVITTFFALILGAFYALFFVQREPFTYYLYVAFPCYFWWTTFLRLIQSGYTASIWKHLFQRQEVKDPVYLSQVLTSESAQVLVIAIVSLQAMVVSMQIMRFRLCSSSSHYLACIS